jgi:HK97 gp10 family phage protein
MADAKVEFKIEGADAIMRKMRQLPKNMQRAGARRAARKAMAVVRDAARATARQFDDPSTPVQIWKQITIAESGRQSRRVGGVVMRVGVRGGARRSKDKVPPWYWRLVEFGTQHTRAQPFMRPALASNVGKVTDTLVRELNKELDKEASKANVSAAV